MSNALNVLHDATDWFIPAEENKPTLMYPGPVVAKGEAELKAQELREALLWRHSQDVDASKDWTQPMWGNSYRVHRQVTVDGVYFMARRIAKDVPRLSDLNLPTQIVTMLSSPLFAESGGLVLVTGSAGQGKSTTAAAILVARAEKYGYFGLTVEDPPEFPMQKFYPSTLGRVGQIIQVPVETGSFAEGLKEAMRCYPSNSKGSMLMVGEVRDPDAASQLLRAAMNGQFVLGTLHASDPIGALERVISLARHDMGESEAKSLLSHSLRAVLHQRIINKTLKMDVLISPNSHSTVAAGIKGPSLSHLSSERERQSKLLEKGGEALLDALFEKKLGGAK